MMKPRHPTSRPCTAGQRRTGAAALAVALAGALAACTPAAAATVTLDVYAGWGNIPQITEPAIKMFEAAHPDIKINEYTLAGGNMGQLLVQLAAGSGPDVMLIQQPDFAGFYQRGLLLDLTSYFQRDIDLSEYLPMFGGFNFEGHYYGIPGEGGGYRTDAMYVNRDLFRAAGLPVPSAKPEQALTFQQWRDAARKLTQDQNGDGNPEQWGAQFRTGRWSYFLPSNGATIFNKDHSDTLIDQPEAVEVLQTLQDLLIHDRTAPTSHVAFADGHLATNVLWRSRTPYYVETIGDAFDWSIAPMPAGIAGSSDVIRMNGFAINKTTKYPDAAWSFLRYFLSEPVQRMIAETGRAMALRKVALDPALVYSSRPPYDLSPFLYGDSVDVSLYEPPPGVDTPDQVNKALADLWSGKISAKTAAQEMAEAWRGALASVGTKR